MRQHHHLSKASSLMDILPLFCDIDDFCLLFEPLWERKLLESRQRRRASTLCLSEVMTIITLFHASSYRNFKAYYTECVLKRYPWAFPQLVSYGRFVELMPEIGRASWREREESTEWTGWEST